MKNDQCVWSGPIINITEAAADTEHPRGKFVHAQNPARNIHLVDALVAQIAVARRPDPMPIVVQILAHEGLLWGWSAPQIVINGFGDRLRAIHLANSAAPLVTEPARTKNFADVSFMQPADRLGNAGARARLRSCL